MGMTLSRRTAALDVRCSLCAVVCGLAGVLRWCTYVAVGALMLALLAPSAAHASFAPTESTQFSCGGQPGHGGWHSTTTAAVAAWVASYDPGAVGPPYGWSGGNCTAILQWNGATATILAYSQPVLACPANATLGAGQCTCNSGYNQNGNSCVNAQCEVGKGRTFNRTEGWARGTNADADDVVSSVGPPQGIYDYNDGVCVGNITAIDRCYRSQEPTTQGLYRLSCDYTMVVTGEASGAGDSAASPTTPNASCPGFVGEVNGKTVCVGTASNPLPSNAAPNSPTVAGNPSAGVKPASGPGSGATGADRTPTTGSGGNTGGPASAAVGRGGTGVRGEAGADGEDAKAVCGAPPLPSCNVKVDETGTPDGSSFGTSSELDGALNSREAGLATARDKAGDASWGIVPRWTEDRECEPWHMFTLPEAVGGSEVGVDLCPLMPIADGILNFIWVMLGIFAVTGLVASAMTGKES